MIGKLNIGFEFLLHVDSFCFESLVLELEMIEGFFHFSFEIYVLLEVVFDKFLWILVSFFVYFEQVDDFDGLDVAEKETNPKVVGYVGNDRRLDFLV